MTFSEGFRRSRDLSSFQRPQHLQPFFLTLKCGCFLVVSRWLCVLAAIARISWGTISRMSFHLVPLFSATSCKEGITQVSQLVRLSTLLNPFSCLPTYNHTCDWFFCYVIHLALAPSQYYLINFPIFIKTLIKKVFIKKNLYRFFQKIVMVAITFRKSFGCKSRNREIIVFF